MSSTGSIVILGNPRSGTTYLLQLLACHNEIEDVGEPLNDEIDHKSDPFGHIDKVLARITKPIVLFKCFPEQLINSYVRFDDLIRHLRCKVVVVVWRQNPLEMFVSRKIASMTGECYSETPAGQVRQIRIDETKFVRFADQIKREWCIMGSQWPNDVVPFFVSYEEIVENGEKIAASILRKAQLDLTDIVFRSMMCRQNPAPLHEKITNWNELKDDIKSLKIDVPKILSETIASSVPVSHDVQAWMDLYSPNRTSVDETPKNIFHMNNHYNKPNTNSIIILGNARSGTTYLQELLASHDDVANAGEPFDVARQSKWIPVDYVDAVLANFKESTTVFKCFPEQLLKINLRLDVLLSRLHCKTIVVIWRRNALETFVSTKIAVSTGEWYSRKPATKINRIDVDETEFNEFVEQLKREWSIMGTQWPIGVSPFFISYEEITSDGVKIAKKVLENVHLNSTDVAFRAIARRQNPAPLEEKIINWNLLSDKAKNTEINVPLILSQAIAETVPVPS